LACTYCWGGERCWPLRFGPAGSVEFSPDTFQKALGAVPNHENSEWYPMLLSMSKRSFAEPVFTHGVRSAAYIGALSPSKFIYDLLYLHRITEFLRNSPALHCFPCSHFGFPVGAGGSLNKAPCRGRPKFRSTLPAKDLPASRSALRMTLQSHPRPRHKEDHDERSKPEQSFLFS
jgi:hypothetical protein